MSLRLIGSARFRPLRNLWMLEELGVPYVHEPVRPRSAEANASNPFGKVPTLIDGEFTIYESVAINTYLGDKYRTSALELVPPPATTARGRYEQLVATIYGELDCQALWIHRKHASDVAKFIGAPNPEATEVARKHADKVVDVLADELGRSGGEYLLGSQFSAADILLVHCCNWAESIGWGERWSGEAPQLQGLATYLERCRSRPAYARAKALP